MDRRWSALAMVFTAVALLFGTGLTAVAAWRIGAHAEARFIMTTADWDAAFQRVASSTFRDAPEPLSRW